MTLAARCHVRCAPGECHAETVDGSVADASLEVAAGATLVLHGCDQADASSPSVSECGGSNGFHFRVQGAVLHDSSTDGEVVRGGALLPASPGRMRLLLDHPIDVAPGDWLQIRGGPTRGHVHRVVAVDLSACPDPAGCSFDVELHDPEMEWGTDAQTSGFGRDIAYLAPPASVRTAPKYWPGTQNFDPDRCVEICGARAMDRCVDSSVLAATHSYVGWYLAAGATTPAPASPASASRRLLIVETLDDVPSPLSGQGDTVDVACLADRIPDAWRDPAVARDLGAVLWPGFRPGDRWVLFRPATVRYVGAEGDGGLGFDHGCVDADFAVFDGWAKLSLTYGTPECQEPVQDSVVISWARGRPDRPFDQQAGCNGHSLDIWRYPALRGDRVALVDTRTPVDTTATCNRGAEAWDGDPESGYHGLSLAHTRFDPIDPPSGWLVRYAGDDGVILDSTGAGASTWEFRDWSFFGNAHGHSTEVIDFLAAEPGQTVRVENARVTQWAADPKYCKGAFDDPTGNVRYEIEGLLYVDPRKAGPIVGFGEQLGSNHVLDGVLAWGGASATCPAIRGGTLRRSWIDGWSRLVDYASPGMDGVYFASRGGTPTLSILGFLRPGVSAEFRDLVLTSLPAVALVSPGCETGCGLSLHDSFAAWRAPSTNGIAFFYSSATVALAAPLERLLFANSRLLGCSDGWSANASAIGTNLLVNAPNGIAITNPGSCAGAATQIQRRSAYYDVRAEIDGATYGPAGRVGLAAGAPLLAEADLASAFAIPAEPCADGVDDDWDRFVDASDPGCDGPNDPSERTPKFACDNGIDDDGDGRVDSPDDPGCRYPASLPENPACDDGVDNDGDGLVDALDPQCANTPYTEQDSCGIGCEISAFVWLLRRLDRTKRRVASKMR